MKDSVRSRVGCKKRTRSMNSKERLPALTTADFGKDIKNWQENQDNAGRTSLPMMII